MSSFSEEGGLFEAAVPLSPTLQALPLGAPRAYTSGRLKLPAAARGRFEASEVRARASADSSYIWSTGEPATTKALKAPRKRANCPSGGT